MESFIIGEIFGAINKAGNNFFHDICSHGCLSLLLRAGCWLDLANEYLLQDYNYEGYQCVHVVANNHRGRKAVQLMEVLMELGTNLNALDMTSGSMPLHIAVIWQDYELVAWICQQAGVNLEACNYAGQTAYQVAWKRNDVKMMDLLRKFGADCEELSSSDDESSDDDS